MCLLLGLVCLLLGGTAVHSQTAVETWTQRYHGPANRSDLVQALVVDSMGNVIVTGFSAASAVYPNNRDYATIKYSGTGVPLWTNRYDGPISDDDRPTAIAVDSNGNVFVTGESLGVGNRRRESATIKYSANGVPLWTNRYHGPANGSDYATALAVYTNGDVIVTGISPGTATAYDYATIRYSSMGIPLWTNRYNGPANSNDTPAAVALDRDGNAFVAGSSSDGTNGDYLTIKYSPAGVPLWINRFNGPGNKGDFVRDVAVDASGNLLVTGEASDGTNSNYATIKYSPDGIPLWTNYYNGPAGDHDAALAIAVDSLGNVLVTGTSSRDGVNYDSDYATIKYSGDGVPLWTNRYDAATGEGAYDIAVDARDNVVITGSSGPLDYPSDYATIKYSAAGVPLWVMRYSARENKSASSVAVAVDPSGAVFVTGNLSDGVNSDFVTIKYAEVWPITFSVNSFTNGLLNVSFTNTPGTTFTIVGTTNLSSDAATWTVRGAVSEIAPGQFSFTNAPATTEPRVFYRVRSP